MQIGKEKESQESMESRKPSEETVPKELCHELSQMLVRRRLNDN